MCTFLFGGNMNLKYMDLAFMEAKKAYDNNEVPIGVVIVKDNSVLSLSYNKVETNNCAIYHAEIQAIIDASKKVNNWRLDGCDMYTTLDPCAMCAGAIKQARISNVYSALSTTSNINRTIINDIFTCADSSNPSVNFISNISPDREKGLLSEFFQKQRKK